MESKITYYRLKFLFVFCVICSVFCVLYSVLHASPLDFKNILKNVHINSSLKIFINNKETKTDVPPVEYGAYIFVPIRFVVENFSAQLKWDNQTKQVEVILGEKGFILKNDSFEIKGKNENISLPASVFIYKGRIMIPLELSASALGGEVKKENKNIYVTTLKKVTDEIKIGKNSDTSPENLIKKNEVPTKGAGFYKWPNLTLFARINYVIKNEILHNHQNKFMGPLLIIFWFSGIAMFFFKLIFSREKQNTKIILKKIAEEKEELLEEIKDISQANKKQ